VVHGIEAAIAAAGDAPEVMIIGGASFYEQMLPRADRLYLTFVHAEPEGDAWFPAFNDSDWKVLKRMDCEADEKNAYAHSFLILERRR
jgi:dihydrofolate reductase